MTDEEMALRVGKQLIDNEIKIAVLKATLSDYRNPDGTQIDWADVVRRTLSLPQFVDQARRRLDELKTAISEDKSGEPLIRIVHQALCNR